MSETILVVEDKTALRGLVCSILRMYGYTMLEAGQGTKALRICQQHEGPIHLLLTDVHMPEMNGPDLARQVVALRPSIRVLYMSAYADIDALTPAGPEAGVAFIQKPFTPDALVRKVREVLGEPA